MQRLNGELNSHKPIVEQLLESGQQFQEDNPQQESDIQEKCQSLAEKWNELNALAEDR